MNISFSLTTAQIKNRSKTVTRRTGWAKLKVGAILEACEKCQGLKKGEHPVKLGKIRVVSVRLERLARLTADLGYGFSETAKEGFPDGHALHLPTEFITFFCAHNKCTPDRIVTRIEFEYL